ncbi:MAG: hypothetical protein EOO60_08280 [Hymenobacter sp.]|nr:MAG: hypothetical protein EOO60_08280 [Hymenobacter sp.]
MSDFLLAPTRAAHAPFTWAARGSSCRYLTYAFVNTRSSCTTPQPVDAGLLTQTIALLSRLVHMQAAEMTDEEISQAMRCITDLDEYREELEIAANPGRQAGIKRAAERLAQRSDYGAAYLSELV